MDSLKAVDRTRESLAGLRVALVHEWLSSYAGSEQTFREMSNVLPNAELFAMSHNSQHSYDFGVRPIHVSFLDSKLKDGGRAAVLPLMPLAMYKLAKTRSFDVVITSSHAFSRAFRPSGNPLHLSYTYAPARYLWMADLERNRSRLAPPRLARWPFRQIDSALAGRTDHFAAISTEIAERIQRCYHRTSRVIYPPVDTEFFSSVDNNVIERHGALAVSRLIPYKRLDLAIQACALAGVPLKIIGSGPDRRRLEGIARRSNCDVLFMGAVTRQELREAYRSTEVVVFPAHEDFGIVPVEAQASGAAVVALDSGGSRETVRRTGTSLVATPDAESFARAITDTLNAPDEPQSWRAHAEQFNRLNFQESFSTWVIDSVEKGKNLNVNKGH